MSTKPNVNKVWASTALPINIKDPDIEIAGKTTQGWLGDDTPPHTTFNWEQNRQGEFNRHVNVEGMPVWDAETGYLLNSYAKDPTTGRLFRSLTGTELSPNVGNQPSLSATEWKELIETELELVITPVNLAPTNGVAIANVTPKLVTSEYRSLYGLEHIDSEYRVARDAAMTDLVYLSGSLGPVTEHTVTTPLALDDTYYFDARYQDEDGSWSTRSTPSSFDIPLSVVQAPNLQSPTNGALNVTDTVLLIGDAFASLPSSTHSASQWQISTDPTFTTVDFDSGEDVVNLTSFSQSGLSLTTAYYWRARYKSNTIGFSDWSTVFSFNTVADTVATPVNESPVDTASGIGGTVQLTASDFASVPALSQTHLASQWQVATDFSFSNIIFDSGEDDFNKESIIATGMEPNITTHYWRVRYKGDLTSWSSYSTPTSFTTVKSFADWTKWDGTNDGPTSTQLGATDNSASTPKADLAPIGGGRFIKVVNGASSQYSVLGTDGLIVSKAARYSAGGSSPSATSVLPAGVDRAVAIYVSSNTVRAKVINVDGNALSFGAENTISASVGTGRYFNICSIDDDNFVIIEQTGLSSQTYVSICTITGTNTIVQGAKTALTADGYNLPSYGSNCSVIGNRLILAKTPSLAAVRYTVCLLDLDTKVVTEDVLGPIFIPSLTSTSISRNNLAVEWITENTFIGFVMEAANPAYDWYLVMGTYTEGVGINIDTVAQMPLGSAISANESPSSIAIISPQEAMVVHTGAVTTTTVDATFVKMVNGNVFHNFTANGIMANSQQTVKKSAVVVGEGRVLIASGNSTVGSEAKILNGGAV